MKLPLFANENTMHSQYCENDSQGSEYTTMSTTSTDNSLELTELVRSTLSRLDFLASHSPALEIEKAKMMKDTFGLSSETLLLIYDQNTQYWKMYEDYSALPLWTEYKGECSGKYSATFPKFGICLLGEFGERQILGPHIGENESLLLQEGLIKNDSDKRNTIQSVRIVWEKNGKAHFCKQNGECAAISKASFLFGEMRPRSSNKRNAGKKLLALRGKAGAKVLSMQIGGCCGVCKTKILQPQMCRCTQAKRKSEKIGDNDKVQKVQERQMRRVRDDGNARSTSLGQEQIQQQPEKPENIVCKLPLQSSLGGRPETENSLCYMRRRCVQGKLLRQTLQKICKIRKSAIEQNKGEREISSGSIGAMIMELPMLERRTEGTECSLWRTPQGHNGTQGPKSKEFYERRLKTNESMITLTDQARHEGNWPTPRANDAEKRGDIAIDVRNGLPSAVKLWPTATGCMWKGSGPTVIRKDGKNRAADRLDYAVANQRNEVSLYGKKEDRSSVEALRVLRENDESSGLQREVGGCCSVQQKKILQSAMYGDGSQEGSPNEIGDWETIDSATEETMRNLWDGIQFTDSSLGWEQTQQFFEELNDRLRKLPYEVALATWENLEKKISGLCCVRCGKPCENHVREALAKIQKVWRSADDKGEHWWEICFDSGGQLSACWTEILMNYPIGWTDIECDNPQEWPGWPAPMGCNQYPYEPPRVIAGQKNWAKRLKCLGNSVVPKQAYPIFKAIMEVENALQNQTARPQQTD